MPMRGCESEGLPFNELPDANADTEANAPVSPCLDRVEADLVLPKPESTEHGERCVIVSDLSLRYLLHEWYSTALRGWEQVENAWGMNE